LALSIASSTSRSPIASIRISAAFSYSLSTKPSALNRHIRAGWSPLAGLGDYIEVLPPQMRVSQQWYQAPPTPYQNIYLHRSKRSKFVFILSGIISTR